MAATAKDVADAVVDALNAADLSQSFTAERGYVPVHEAENLDTLEVTVVARDITGTMLARNADDFLYGVDVGVQVRVGSGSMTNAQINAAADPFVLLAQEVLDLFRGKPIEAGDDRLICTAFGIDPIYDPDHMDRFRVFTSVVQLTFKLVRAR